MMYTGGCLCGAVRFTLEGDIDVVNCCHCSRCRKRSGSAFATIVHARFSDFTIVTGEDEISVYESEQWGARHFCRNCGSPLPGGDEEANHVGIAAGLFDEGMNTSPGLHIMTGSKAQWFDISDQIPQHVEFPENW